MSESLLFMPIGSVPEDYFNADDIKVLKEPEAECGPYLVSISGNHVQTHELLKVAKYNQIKVDESSFKEELRLHLKTSRPELVWEIGDGVYLDGFAVFFVASASSDGLVIDEICFAANCLDVVAFYPRAYCRYWVNVIRASPRM
jgi:hypothetical protein